MYVRFISGPSIYGVQKYKNEMVFNEKSVVEVYFFLFLYL
tara:strand:+ start:3211 stop:3330 length:120 start_codon:yes stop_codon:yes gene_type:complete